MHVRTLKLLLPLLIALVGVVFVLAVNPPVMAAPPDVPPATGHVVEKAGVSLDKKANVDVIPLGQAVTYTLTIKNDSQETIEASLTDTLPNVVTGLALQVNTISTTVGLAEPAGNSLNWNGSLAPGEEAIITYQAIPPTTSEAGQSLKNVAVLKFGETTLQAEATVVTQPPNLGIWGSFVNFIALALVFFNQTLESINIPYAFGFAIILFTIAVRLATFPLNVQQIKSSKAMQELQPKLKELQDKYKGDREKLAQEQMRMYREAGVNPLGGCLPMLVQMPIWFALYQALIQLSHEGLLNQGFLWIPSLAGPPVSNAGGFLPPWLTELPLEQVVAYLVMPILLVVSQFYMQQLMTPPSTDPQQAQMQSMMKFMPIMFGYFSLIVPSGLTLYWFTSNILGVAQHYFTKTQFDQAPVKAGAPLSSPVPASTPVTATTPGETAGEDKKEKHAKPKRKSRRKR